MMQPLTQHQRVLKELEYIRKFMYFKIFTNEDNINDFAVNFRFKAMNVVYDLVFQIGFFNVARWDAKDNAEKSLEVEFNFQWTILYLDAFRRNPSEYAMSPIKVVHEILSQLIKFDDVLYDGINCPEEILEKRRIEKIVRHLSTHGRTCHMLGKDIN